MDISVLYFRQYSTMFTSENRLLIITTFTSSVHCLESREITAHRCLSH